MSKASRSGTRFLPTDINQLSRVTNERRVGTKPYHHGPPYVHTHAHRTHEKGEHPNDGSRHLLHLRECRISCRLVGSTAVPRARDFICDYKIATTKAKRTTFKLYDIVYGDPCDLFEKRASANGSIMHNHVARRKV